MSLTQNIIDDRKKALLAKDEFLLSVLKLLVSEINNKKIEFFGAEGGELSDDQVTVILQKEVKKRDEAAALYRQGGRVELAEKEEKEKALLSKYLPQQMDVAELVKIISKVVGKTGAKGPADFGKVMSQVMALIKGRTDGKIVAEEVKRQLLG